MRTYHCQQTRSNMVAASCKRWVRTHSESEAVSDADIPLIVKYVISFRIFNFCNIISSSGCIHRIFQHHINLSTRLSSSRFVGFLLDNDDIWWFFLTFGLLHLLRRRSSSVSFTIRIFWNRKRSFDLFAINLHYSLTTHYRENSFPINGSCDKTVSPVVLVIETREIYCGDCIFFVTIWKKAWTLKGAGHREEKDSNKGPMGGS